MPLANVVSVPFAFNLLHGGVGARQLGDIAQAADRQEQIAVRSERDVAREMAHLAIRRRIGDVFALAGAVSAPSL